MKGNAYATTVAACEGKQVCSVTVCFEAHQAPSSPTQPCVGTSPAPTDPAFGCGKTFEVTYTCESKWGWTFIIIFAVAAAVYAGGGSKALFICLPPPLAPPTVADIFQQEDR